MAFYTVLKALSASMFFSVCILAVAIFQDCDVSIYITSV
jgi:hypothetical protein